MGEAKSRNLGASKAQKQLPAAIPLPGPCFQADFSLMSPAGFPQGFLHLYVHPGTTVTLLCWGQGKITRLQCSLQWLTVSAHFIFSSLKPCHTHLCAASLNWSKSGRNTFPYMLWISSLKTGCIVGQSGWKLDFYFFFWWKGWEVHGRKNTLCISVVW